MLTFPILRGQLSVSLMWSLPTTSPFLSSKKAQGRPSPSLFQL